jgi:hypothetical protein
MKKHFSLKMSTGNDENNKAFSRILREIAEKIDEGRTEGIIRDSNGNPIGTFSKDA